LGEGGGMTQVVAANAFVTLGVATNAYLRFLLCGANCGRFPKSKLIIYIAKTRYCELA
jgi:hypothetical protein